MGFLSSLFGGKSGGDGRFKTEEAYERNRALQLTMTPKTVAQLRNYGVTDKTELKLEYFFYTNSEEKAASLAQKLKDLGYEGSHGLSAGKRKEQVITGWTSRMKMDDQTVRGWTDQMCCIGQEHDCEFDGWGTNPKQT